MNIRNRKLIGALGLGVYMLAYIAIVSAIGARMTGLSDWIELAFYAAAGIAWIVPLKPLFAWMNRP